MSGHAKSGKNGNTNNCLARNESSIAQKKINQHSHGRLHLSPPLSWWPGAELTMAEDLKSFYSFA